jgi:hypothetical protein
VVHALLSLMLSVVLLIPVLLVCVQATVVFPTQAHADAAYRDRNRQVMGGRYIEFIRM